MAAALTGSARTSSLKNASCCVPEKLASRLTTAAKTVVRCSVDAASNPSSAGGMSSQISAEQAINTSESSHR
ncbi:hypothetical protein ON010_g6360 [Phytophthora cinnamomi]|nr:hypothetical protein ON010_g6360 [Phytophthora cinnamomi]